MPFKYSKENLEGRQKTLQRVFEILPGLTSWAILIGMAGLSVLQPMIAVIFSIAFYLYWLLRLLYMTIFLALSYFRLKIEQHTDWMTRIQYIDDLQKHPLSSSKNIPALDFEQISRFTHKKELLRLQKSLTPPPPSQNIYHLVIYPIVKESREIIEPAINSLYNQKFPTSRILVILALEERAQDEIKDTVFSLEKKFKGSFLDILTIIHPSAIPGEARVKGANVTYAAQKAAQYFQKRNIPYENVIVSCFDADTVVSPEYFSCLTYYFMVTPERLRSSFQPIPVYHNNIWDVPGFARVIETGSSFFQLIESTNPKKLVTFSSHSMSFKALVDADYWPVDMVSDDSAIYWKCLIHFGGKYHTIPMYITLSMDIAGSTNFWDTVKSVYKQKRRWAWGVENFPIVMRAFMQTKKISFYNKVRYGFKLFEGHISWATWGFLLSFIGWLPAVFANQKYSSSVLYYNTPRITEIIIQLTSISLITSIIVSIYLLPKKQRKLSWKKKIRHTFEWLMIPVIIVLFSALPALDAQTRLMLGAYMEFWVTDKKRKT